MPTIDDREFGTILVTRQALAKRVSFSIAPNGQPRISLPASVPLCVATAFVQTSRARIRRFLHEHQQAYAYTTSQPIGKQHHLVIQHAPGKPTVQLCGTRLIATTPDDTALQTPAVQQAIRHKIIALLRKEARHYLPRRLSVLANTHGFRYQATRLTHASSRWGSCSSRGTISLNIALMRLPFDLIDYVLIHELCHTRHMDHSAQFWAEVARLDPSYQTHRAQLKTHTPHL